MINSAAATSAIALGQAGQIQAPQDNINQFQTLLKSINGALSSGTQSLSKRSVEDAKRNQGTLIEETAASVNEAEIAIKQLEKEVNQSTFELKGSLALNSEFTQSVVYQKFTATAYFVSMSRISNRGENISEEMNSITKRR